MIPKEFFYQNLHFAISLFAALVFFAVAWLHLDAWGTMTKNRLRELLKWVGFLLLSLSFLIHATVIEQGTLGHPLFGNLSENISSILSLLGFISIIAGQIIDPLQPKPVNTGIDLDSLLGGDQDSAKTPKEDTSKPKPVTVKSRAVAGAGLVGHAIAYVLPFGALAVAALYWRRATTGLERHLKPVAYGFAFLVGYEIFSIGSLFSDTTNPSLFNIVKAFGPLWIISHLFLLASAIMLGRWVWQYLTERFLSQMFMIFTTVSLVIFLLTTVTFTYLLMHNVQEDSLNNLSTAVNVLNRDIDSKKAETKANAQVVAENPAVEAAITAKDHKALVALTKDFLADNKQSSLIITNISGQVLLRAEDPQRWGDSLSDDTLIRRAVIGDSESTVVSKDDVVAPVLYIRSATPVRDVDNNIVGAVTSAQRIDNAFVDGLKNSTGLDSAIYSGNVRSATTLVAPDGRSRWIGVKEENKTVNKQVLSQGKTYRGSLSILNRPFLAVYTPLKNIDGQVVGMLFIGLPQISLLQTAGHSIELTFLVTAILLVLSVVPAYLIAKHIARQLG